METELYPTEISTSWIEHLALDELNMEESGVINFNEHLNPEHHLERSSVEFMDKLRDHVEIYVQKFNDFRGVQATNSTAIKIFKISNTVNDFMLFRNSLKLIFSRKSNDLISVAFMSNSGGTFSARLHNDSPNINMCHEINAHIGPFNDISWRFNGEIVDLNSLVKHYLSEFIKHTAR